MPAEKIGNQIRIRVKDPQEFSEFRTDDIGEKGKLQRVAGYKDGNWYTQSYRLNLGDYDNIGQAKKDLYSIREITQSQRSKAYKLIKKTLRG